MMRNVWYVTHWSVCVSHSLFRVFWTWCGNLPRIQVINSLSFKFFNKDFVKTFVVITIYIWADAHVQLPFSGKSNNCVLGELILLWLHGQTMTKRQFSLHRQCKRKLLHNHKCNAITTDNWKWTEKIFYNFQFKIMKWCSNF